MANLQLNPSVGEVIKFGWHWAQRYGQYETQPAIGLVRRFLEAIGVQQPDVNAAAMDVAAQVAAAERPAGAELRVWDTQEEIDRLMTLAARMQRSVDAVLWEAVRRLAEAVAEKDGFDIAPPSR